MFFRILMEKVTGGEVQINYRPTCRSPNVQGSQILRPKTITGACAPIYVGYRANDDSCRFLWTLRPLAERDVRGDNATKKNKTAVVSRAIKLAYDAQATSLFLGLPIVDNSE
ncbi:Hypothetical protein NTJ_15566 [Nesidiocoris tenuis]|uniref:Uncharacterized protein n=1 Tax=Nesidiocoris tenuis TaxID=355587 RepID=A0ABN7BEF4_9HEMI|nr:Hypothetical protein NTJ_15566 [Nesidiocoris tenuis]